MHLGIVFPSVILIVLYSIRFKAKSKKREIYGPSESKNGWVLYCGTRKSSLALKQTRWVCASLSEKFPTLSIVVLDGVDTIADRNLSISLKDMVISEEKKNSSKPSPGLFTKELEEALIQKQYDFVVHSLKDVPTTLPDGLTLPLISLISRLG